MIQSLMDLNTALHKEKTRLVCLFEDTVTALEMIARQLNGPIVALVETKDYTPFAKEREAAIRRWCLYHGAEYCTPEDIYLTNPGSVLTGTGKTFQKFTPFWTTARSRAVPKPVTGVPKLPWFHRSNAFQGEVGLVQMRAKLIPHENRNIHVRGGRTEGLALLKTLPPKYDTERDIPSKRTSNLSAHNHFGTVSIREVYWAGRAVGLKEFVRQLYWRDFYGHLMNAFEELYGESAFDFMKDPAPGWSRDKAAFQAWTEGRTGYTLVDAGMRQLNATGYIHNRARLVCAAYLAKELKVHWRWGERYFAQHLVDYDVTQNMMNWIWVSSVLPFAMAPFRHLDPERQAERFNADGAYAAQWLGEKG